MVENLRCFAVLPTSVPFEALARELTLEQRYESWYHYQRTGVL